MCDLELFAKIQLLLCATQLHDDKPAVYNITKFIYVATSTHTEVTDCKSMFEIHHRHCLFSPLLLATAHALLYNSGEPLHRVYT